MLGELVLSHGGEVWTSTIIDTLALVGVEERNARQAAARLSDEGLIESRRMGRAARWRLTPAGRQLLDAGAERIDGFASGSTGWDGRWLVVFAPVPEHDRAKRHRLRTQLAFTGFGFLGPALAISPHVDRREPASEILRALDLDAVAVVFLAVNGEFVADDEIIRRAWDLEQLSARYEAFLRAFADRSAGTAADCCAAVIDLVHEWRRFPFDDPGIPGQLLPEGWAGVRAKQVFDSCRRSWSSGAADYFRQAEARAEREHSTTT
jgi:phenylacetic acid degradation operon negative regulatory protein